MSKRETTTPRRLAAVIGRTVSAARACHPTLLLSRSSFAVIAAPTRRRPEWDLVIPLSAAARRDMAWMADHLPQYNIHGERLWAVRPTVTLWTDASNIGWGGKLSNLVAPEAAGSWSVEQQRLHINELELWAVLFSLRTFCLLLRGEQVELQIDSQVAYHYCRDYRGGRVPQLSRIVCKIFMCALSAGIEIVNYEWLPTHENVDADRLSRVVDSGDWMIRPDVFLAVQECLGPFTCDLFAASHNHVLQRFVSRYAQDGAESVDAFQRQSWKVNRHGQSEHLWICVPFGLISRVLRRLDVEGAVATIVVPEWHQPWWPRLLRMERVKMLLPLGHQSFIPTHSGYCEPLKFPRSRFWAVTVVGSAMVPALAN